MSTGDIDLRDGLQAIDKLLRYEPPKWLTRFNRLADLQRQTSSWRFRLLQWVHPTAAREALLHEQHMLESEQTMPIAKGKTVHFRRYQPTFNQGESK